MNYDYEKLREDLSEYFEKCVSNDPFALIDFVRTEIYKDEELPNLAKKAKINLEKYIVEKQEKKR